MTAGSTIEEGRITFRMLSDWHIGTGTGIPGGVNALVARDKDGFPFIPAKTVVGIWRDAAETLARGLDSGSGNQWQNWIDAIFGNQPNNKKRQIISPKKALLSLEPASMNSVLRSAIVDDAQFKQALTFVKPNTKIDSLSGTAADSSLRFTEMGRIGSVLSSGFQLNLTGFPTEHEQLIKALLIASASLVQRIGGNRRRGSGRCETVVECGLADAVSVLEKFKLDVPSPPSVKSATEMRLSELPDNQISSKDQTWGRLEYTLKLHSPVAIVTNTLGNVSETLDFIPGTYLLPFISRNFHGLSKHVSCGDFQVSQATLEIDGKAGHPVPKVIWYDKVGGGFEKANTVYNELCEAISGGEQKKNFRDGYISTLGNAAHQLPHFKNTAKTLLIHNTIEDNYQRPTAEVGGVFTRHAISAGTILRGEIRFKSSLLEEVEQLVGHSSYLRLGTSKKDDYGQAEIQFGSEIDSRPPKGGPVGNELVVYLESDVLLRNCKLRQTNLIDDLRSALQDELKVGLEAHDTKRSLIQVRRIESWHEGWGFPRPTFAAMAGGSVAVFSIDGVIDPDNLKRIERSGIGERRGEGYGQIRFNRKILTNPINGWTVPNPLGVDDHKDSDNEEALETDQPQRLEKLKRLAQHDSSLKLFIENIELAAWRKELANAALKIASNPLMRSKIWGFTGDTPPANQIGGLRSTIGKVNQNGSNRTVVLSWLKHLSETPNRSKKWNQDFGEIARVFSQENSQLIWDYIETDWEMPPVLVSPESEIKKKLWTEAVKSVFDACARAEDRGRKRNELAKEAVTNGA